MASSTERMRKLRSKNEHYDREYREAHPDRDKSYRAKNKADQYIVILDMETDPFDNVAMSEVYPYLVVLYSEVFDPIVIWDDDWKSLMAKTYNSIMALSGQALVYAHNGGRFDYMFLLRELRGDIKFKGRGIMSARIGQHELRDSYMIIPEKLEVANKKDQIDYQWFLKDVRHSHRQEIIDYCISDCRYTYEVVKAFVDEFGTPMSIGQASIKALKKLHPFKTLTQRDDEYLRQYFMGGRCECISPGYHEGDFSLFDVNGMYPFVMAHYDHPIGNEFVHGDQITDSTRFVHIRGLNHGALLSRTENGELTSKVENGEFKCSIFEFNVALRYGLIENVDIIGTIDIEEATNFSAFILPLYARRQHVKELLATATDPEEINRLKRESLFLKLLMNNAYGKFAQNPRHFQEHYLTDPYEKPPMQWLMQGLDSMGIDYSEELYLRSFPNYETDKYWIWSIGAPSFRFNNVATAASITGAARAVLLEALQNCVSPLYCDTDSIICHALRNVDISPFKLGSWDKEAEIDRYIGAGKKLYGYHKLGTPPPKDYIVRAKGSNAVTWQDLQEINSGKVIRKTLTAPILSKDGTQKYQHRELKKTA